MQLINGYVMTKPIEQGFDQDGNYKTKSGLLIPFVQGFQQYHQPVVHEVVEVPKGKLPYKSKNTLINMRWKTTCELQKGDHVLINYFEVQHCMRQDGFFFPRYQDMYLAKRGDEVIMLNGYILMDEWKKEESKKVSDLWIPEAPENKHKNKYAIIKYIGKPNEEYDSNKVTDDIKVVVGDVVMLRKPVKQARRTEDILHLKLFDKVYFLRQRKDIVGLVEL